MNLNDEVVAVFGEPEIGMAALKHYVQTQTFRKQITTIP